MALSVKKGSFAVNTATGNQAVTGVGFQPKAALYWVTMATADATFTANDRLSFGMAVSSSAQGCAAMASDDALGSSPQTERFITANRCLNVIDHLGTHKMEGTFVSMDADGFTININVADVSNAYIVHYLALGGADITNATVLTTATTDTTTSTHSKTGVGFQPDFVLVTHDNGGNALGSVATNAGLGVGAVAGTNQASLARKVATAVASSVVGSYQRVSSMISMLSGNPVVVEFEAAISSLDSDGWTWNVTTPDSVAHPVVALCLKGGNYYVGSDTQKTSTGTQAKTGFGFSPTGLLFLSDNLAAGTTVDSSNGKQSVGGTDGTTQGAAWAGTQSGQATSVAKSRSDTSKTLVLATPPSTVNASATITSLDSDGYTLNWGAADATARSFLVIAFGNAGGVVHPLTLSASSSSGASVATAGRVKLLTVAETTLVSVSRLPGRIFSVIAVVSSYSQIPIALGLAGSVVSVTTQVIGSATRTLVATVSPSALLNRVTTRLLPASTAALAAVTTFIPISIRLTVSASALAHPLMWLRRRFQIHARNKTSIDGLEARTPDELTMDPTSPTTLP